MEAAALQEIALWLLGLTLGALIYQLRKGRRLFVEAALGWLFYLFITYYALFLLVAFNNPLITLLSVFLLLYFSVSLFYFESLEKLYSFPDRLRWLAAFFLLLAYTLWGFFSDFGFIINLPLGYLAVYLAERGMI